MQVHTIAVTYIPKFLKSSHAIFRQEFESKIRFSLVIIFIIIFFINSAKDNSAIEMDLLAHVLFATDTRKIEAEMRCVNG